MICYIYRSIKKAEMYLYITQKDDFTKVPEQLIKSFGNPEFSLMVNLGKRNKLARVDIDEVKKEIQNNGFYLQMPPTILDDQNFLNQ